MSAASMARPYRGEQPAGATSIGDIVDETQFEELMTRLADVRRTRPLAPSGAARTLHRWILRHFGDTATAPPPEVVKEWAIELDVNLRDLLTQLIRLELIDADPDTTRVSGAYPFAENDHGHGVTVAGVHVVHAYCATGALGISALLGRDVSITSTDPGTGQEVRVQVLGQRASWQPSQAAVSVPTVDSLIRSDGQGQAGHMFCPTTNFFVDATAAHAYAARHSLNLNILTMPQALRGAELVFGGLLKRPAGTAWS